MARQGRGPAVTVPVVGGGSSFNHVGQVVTDLDRSKRFYQEVFGFEQVLQLEPPDQGSASLLRLEPPLGMTSCYLKRGDFILELLHFSGQTLVEQDERVMNQLGLTHVSLSVDSLDDALTAVEAHGGEVLTDTNIGVAVFVKDPDGQLLELLTGWKKP
jgi:catechol 2,3-dioxygenase-like lactoylglutathione lyase family enzyme